MRGGRGVEGSCRRKIRYHTWAEADVVCQRINQGELRGIGELILAYRCRFGAHWHVGHVPWRELRESVVPALRSFDAGKFPLVPGCRECRSTV